MDISEGWILEIGEPGDAIEGIYGDTMNIELDLKKAASFVTYNKTSMTIKIE